MAATSVAPAGLSSPAGVIGAPEDESSQALMSVLCPGDTPVITNVPSGRVIAWTVSTMIANGDAVAGPLLMLRTGSPAIGWPSGPTTTPLMRLVGTS